MIRSVKALVVVMVSGGLLLAGVSNADAATRVSGASKAARVLPVPYISQFSPKGKDSSYKNGSSNCGPTSMAMIARFYKYPAGSKMTDAQLVTHFNLADGKATGATDADGIKAMGKRMGKPVTQRLGPDLTFVDQSLASGKPLAARGVFSGVGRHYIVITGKDTHGSYTVNDPADSSRKTITPSKLSTFIKSHPEGAFFSIG